MGAIPEHEGAISEHGGAISEHGGGNSWEPYPERSKQLSKKPSRKHSKELSRSFHEGRRVRGGRWEGEGGGEQRKGRSGGEGREEKTDRDAGCHNTINRQAYQYRVAIMHSNETTTNKNERMNQQIKHK